MDYQKRREGLEERARALDARIELLEGRLAQVKLRLEDARAARAAAAELAEQLELSGWIERRIMELRAEGHGPKVIARALRSERGINMTHGAIWKRLERAGRRAAENN